jgi:hypothetical protein
MTLVRPKGLLLHGEAASVDTASSQSNQRGFLIVGKISGGEAIAVSGQISGFHGGVFACEAMRHVSTKSATIEYHISDNDMYREKNRVYGSPILLCHNFNLCLCLS